ncbi:RNA polymerase sigma factor [Phytohabitans sp. LJ34]|uniref:RNA polymerase sigma factor n=1 Tax=Phytohabitans sp. LJ34 TaxID=3452217 RepID=UPI003F8B2026
MLATVGDRTLAEDLVAEAFARAWGVVEQGQPPPAPQAWVVRTAYNTHVSWWRCGSSSTSTPRPRPACWTSRRAP